MTARLTTFRRRCVMAASVSIIAATLAACSDNAQPSSVAAPQAPGQTSTEFRETEGPDRPGEVTTSAELASATSAQIQQRAESFWDAGDYESAVSLADIAFRKDGNPNAAYRLGTAYYRGFGVQQDLERAWRYLSVPALDESRFALYFRGLIKAAPEFVERDIDQARGYLERARELGVAQAEAALSSLATPRGDRLSPG